MSRDTIISIGTLVVAVALGLINSFGRRRGINEGRFGIKTGKEIE